MFSEPPKPTSNLSSSFELELVWPLDNPEFWPDPFEPEKGIKIF